MTAAEVSQLVQDLLIILAAGLVSGILCKRLGISLVVGYLVVGAVIGQGGLHVVSGHSHELELLAEIGALLLLFAVGIEFSLDELTHLGRYILVGGAVQMTVVTLPTWGCMLLLGMPWQPALLVSLATALSSTVLVFKALTEWGQVGTPHGRRAIGILLFQDVALVPLMLLVPLLTGASESFSFSKVGLLLVNSAIFIGGVLAVRSVIARWIIPLLGRLRSVELVLLFTGSVLVGFCLGAHLLQLPAAVGALAAGMAISGNRLSKQIDTLVLPFRETFAATFFVSLGTLLHAELFLAEPVALLSGLVGVFVLKTAAAALALRLVGLSWRNALLMGMALFQLGEFSFLLVAEGVSREVIDQTVYSRMLFIALGTLIITPQLLKWVIRWIREPADEAASPLAGSEKEIVRAAVIGAGPIGRQITSRLEMQGVSVTIVDLSPVNLYQFDQQGFRTVAGDARSLEVLRRAEIGIARIIIVCVPDDAVALEIVKSLREISSDSIVLVRCRYLGHVTPLLAAGANEVVSEEKEASGALVKICERYASHG